MFPLFLGGFLNPSRGKVNPGQEINIHLIETLLTIAVPNKYRSENHANIVSSNRIEH